MSNPKSEAEMRERVEQLGSFLTAAFREDLASEEGVTDLINRLDKLPAKFTKSGEEI